MTASSIGYAVVVWILVAFAMILFFQRKAVKRKAKQEDCELADRVIAAISESIDAKRRDKNEYSEEETAQLREALIRLLAFDRDARRTKQWRQKRALADDEVTLGPDPFLQLDARVQADVLKRNHGFSRNSHLDLFTALEDLAQEEKAPPPPRRTDPRQHCSPQVPRKQQNRQEENDRNWSHNQYMHSNSAASNPGMMLPGVAALHASSNNNDSHRCDSHSSPSSSYDSGSDSSSGGCD